MSIDLQHTHKATKERLILLLEDYGKRAYLFTHEIIEPYFDFESQRFSTWENSEKLSLCWARLEGALSGLTFGRAMLEHPFELLTTIENRIIEWMADFHWAATQLIKVFEKRIGNVEPNIERDNAIRAQLAKLRGGEIEPRVEPNFAPDIIKDRAQVKKIRDDLRLLGDGTELRRFREARLTAIEEAQKKVAFIRNSNPFRLPENIEDFHFDSMLELARRNGYPGKAQNLVELLNNHSHGTTRKQRESLKESGETPDWTPQSELMFDRENLVAFLEKHAPKWRKKTDVKEK